MVNWSGCLEQRCGAPEAPARLPPGRRRGVDPRAGDRGDGGAVEAGRHGRRERARGADQAKLLPDQVIDEVGGVQPARGADEPHRGLRHLRRDVEGILGAAGTLDLHLVGLGFSKTTPWVKTREKGTRGGSGSARPSQNRKLPPSLPWLFPGGLPVLEKAYSPAVFGLGVHLLVAHQHLLRIRGATAHVVGITDLAAAGTTRPPAAAGP